MFSLTLVAPDYKTLLPRLNVPVIQAITCTAPYTQWRDSVQGLPTVDVSYSAAQPEFDGALITIPIATREQKTIDPITGALPAKYMPIPERVDKMVHPALNWAPLLAGLPINGEKWPWSFITIPRATTVSAALPAWTVSAVSNCCWSI
jgi:cobaltochelatase CobN